MAAAVANPQRPAEDLAKDANRKPDQVLSKLDLSKEGLQAVKKAAEQNNQTAAFKPNRGELGVGNEHEFNSFGICQSCGPE